ncbi:type II toxin-antitoxin system VapC family toxin [uncultured Brevundimonas sp.]|uniref:type II toxin-antitoxin system VapC family toxin n=1 Tax=uncultured Brevundimonas sp. TaxID=213418 RepID=UPI00263432B9|nr:type II toxin-antitoxin system VapC family toxin [uncultured Brevundimonas sp.]
MIAVDTSALMAVLRKEELGQACEAALKTDQPILMSAATVAECLIVTSRKRTLPGMKILLDLLEIRVIDVTSEVAQAAADAYTLWGKGFHEAGLNYGDCFSYVAARTHDCPLLYVGDDFARTDVVSALA